MARKQDKPRDWKKYNESLVRRGEMLLDFSVIDEWETELEKANRDKVGEPFHYPEGLIRLLGSSGCSFIYRTGSARDSYVSFQGISRDCGYQIFLQSTEG